MNRVLLLVLLLLSGLVAFAQEPAQLTTIVLVRHAEKSTADPNDRDPALAPSGQQRAERLAAMLAHADVTTIYTTPYKRTRDTAAPLAGLKKLTPIEVDAAATFAQEMASRLREHRGGTVVVVGHSNTTQDVMKALGISDAPKIEDHEYGNVFVVTIGEGVKPRMVRLTY